MGSKSHNLLSEKKTNKIIELFARFDDFSGGRGDRTKLSMLYARTNLLKMWVNQLLDEKMPLLRIYMYSFCDKKTETHLIF